MTNKRIIIFYGTRYGSTEGIAGKMAEIIREKNLTAEVVNLKDLPKDKIPDMTQYDGILIGTGIKIGQWTKEVKKFVTDRKEELNNFKGPKGFFVSSGYAALPEKYEEVKIDYTRNALAKRGVEVDQYDAFGGLMDLTETSRMGWLEKKILKTVGKQSLGLKSETDSYTDLRDWEQIENFTLEFVNLILT